MVKDSYAPTFVRIIFYIISSKLSQRKKSCLGFQKSIVTGNAKKKKKNFYVFKVNYKIWDNTFLFLKIIKKIFILFYIL